MKRGADEYTTFVTHPRYGQRPRVTGLSPEPDAAGNVFIHWHSPSESRIQGTAIVADLARQTPATIPVTHYFDAKRDCRDCGRPFLFFAEEQKYWYEQLGFGLDSDCVRCTACRKTQQGFERTRARYAELSHLASPTIHESLELVQCWLELVEASVFGNRQAPRMRSLLSRLSTRIPERAQGLFRELSMRMQAACNRNDG
jgi:hypothetical protein